MNGQNGQPDPYADHEAILALVRRKMTDWSKGRETIVRAAWRNILFYRGHQWIRFDRSLNRWRPSVLSRNTPTPVTNLYASTLDAVNSVLARVEPTLTFRPATDEPQDRATADVAIRAIQVIEDEVHIREIRQSLAKWVSLTGGAWLETGYDPDPVHGLRLLQHEQCFGCGTTQPMNDAQRCQHCGGGLLAPAFDPATGAPVGEMVPVGRLFADVVPIFEMYFDLSQPDWSKQRAYCREKAVPLDEAKARWPHLADRLQPDSLSSDYQLYGESLPTLGAYLGETATRTLQSAGAGLLNTRVTERWYWSLPDETYPDGLLAIVVGKQHLGHAGPLPYRIRQAGGPDKPFLPHKLFPLHLVPGSAWAKTVADDLALKATQRNRLESMIEQIIMRAANPVWLLPEGCNVSAITGEPGQKIRYNALGPTPAKPERIPGQSIPAGLLAWMEKIDKEFEELGATFEVIKGARPEGVSAGIALQILQERGMSRFAPLFILWESAWSSWSQQALEIFRQFATEERLLRIKGRDGRWQVEKFTGGDLQGRIDVVAEAGSSLPRSSLVDRAEIQQLLAMGILNPADPEVRFKVLEVFGRTNLVPGMAADVQNAIKEQEAFEALARHPGLAQMSLGEVESIGLLPPEQVTAQLSQVTGLALPRVRPAVDDHAVHAREHTQWLKSETAQALPLAVQLLAEQHAAQHQRLLAVQMQTMLQARTGQSLPGGQPDTPPQPLAPEPLASGASPQRMGGDMREMAERMMG